MSDGNLPVGAGPATTINLPNTLAQLANLAGLPSQYQPLTQPLSKFGGASNGALSYKIVDANPSLSLGDLTLGVAAQLSLNLDAFDQWPFAGDKVSDNFLSIGAKGALKANAGATVTLPYGSLGASSEDSVDLEIDFYFNVADRTQLYGAAVAACLTNLVNPFDFHAVWAALTQTDLAGVVFKFDGKAAFSAKASLAVGGDIASIASAAITAKLGADISAGVSITDTYTLSLRSQPNSAGTGKVVVATLGRNPGVEKDINGNIGLKIDLSQVGGLISEPFSKLLGIAQAELDSLKPFLTPGTLLRTTASDQFDKLVDDLTTDPALRAALDQDAQMLLGVTAGSGEEGLTKWVGDQIAGAIDRTAKVISGDAKDVGDAVFGELGRLLPSFALAKAQTLIEAQVPDLISTAQTQLKAEVDKLRQSVGAQLGQALQQAGVASSAVVNDLDKTFSGVQALFDKYYAILGDLVKASEEVAKATITATVAFSETISDSSDYRVRGTFTDNSAAAKAVFDTLVHGQLGPLADLLRRGPVPGFLLDRSSSLAQTSSVDQSLGLNLAFLNVSLDLETLVSGKAAVMVDGAGTIQVDAQTTLDQKFNGLNASQDVTFFSTEALAIAGVTRSNAMGMGFGISTTGKSLTRGLITAFIGSLSKANLLPADAATNAAKQLATWIGPGSNNSLPGSFAINLPLISSDIQQLMALAPPSAGPADSVAAETIVNAALSALQRTGVTKESDLQDAMDWITQLYSPPTTFASPAQAIRKFPSLKPPFDPDPHGGANPSDADVAIKGFSDVASLCNNLVTLLQTARDIYQAKPQPPGAPAIPGAWTDIDYRKHEQIMSSVLDPWLTVDEVLFVWLLGDVSQRTVAFLRTIADLSGHANDSPLVLTMTYRPISGDPQTAIIV